MEDVPAAERRQQKARPKSQRVHRRYGRRGVRQQQRDPRQRQVHRRIFGEREGGVHGRDLPRDDARVAVEREGAGSRRADRRDGRLREAEGRVRAESLGGPRKGGQVGPRVRRHSQVSGVL
ncbi:unnamed protein product [Linum tenue]|uniref:Uncharacterized protein n=1 Tax=Linum tenue TaxID=586396 RepID=A0AAV0MFT9_9ROSI|nr:unnamed protein product [Linum tenue]